MAIAKSAVQEAHECVRQFHRVCELRAQERVAFFVRELVEAVFKRVQIAVAGTINTTAVGQVELIGLVERVSNRCTRKPAQVLSTEHFILTGNEAGEFTFPVGMFSAETSLETPLF